MPCHLALWWAPAETTRLTPQTLRRCARLLRCMLRLRWLHGQGTLHASRQTSVPHPHAVLCGVVCHPRPCAPAAQLWAVGQARGAPGAFAYALATRSRGRRRAPVPKAAVSARSL